MKIWKHIFWVLGVDAIQLSLRLETPFVFRPGIEPSILTASVTYRDFDKLKSELQGREGEVRFYSSKPAPFSRPSPGVVNPADIVFKGMRLIDCEAMDIGLTPGIRGDKPQRRATRWLLHLADPRHRLVYPGGNVVDLGEINKEPWNKDRTKDANGNVILRRSDLIAYCLDQMAIKGVTVPPTVDSAGDVLNLEWRGNHAPTELAKLLDQCEHLLIMQPDGTFSIQKAGTGKEPEAPDQEPWKTKDGLERWYNLPRPLAERRGLGVLFTSHPNPILDTVKVSTSTGTLAPCIKDIDGVWKFLDKTPAVLNGSSAAYTMKNLHFNVLPAYREITRRGLYHFWTVDLTRFGPHPFLRTIRYDLNEQRRWDDELKFDAVIARKRPNGLDWYNTDDKVRVKIEAVHAMGAVLQTAERIGKVKALVNSDDPARMTFDFHFEECKPGEVELTFTREVELQDVFGNWRPQFTEIGCILDAGKIRLMTAAEIANFKAKASIDYPVVQMPEMVEQRIEGAAINRKALEDKALKLAPAWIQAKVDSAKDLHAVGFMPFVMSGKVVAVTIAQNPPETKVELNAFRRPGANYFLVDKEFRRQAITAAYPGQQVSQATKTIDGASGVRQTAVPMAPQPGDRPQLLPFCTFAVDLTKDDGDDGDQTKAPTYKYTARSLGQLVGKKMSPLAGRCWGTFTPATKGIAYIDQTGTGQLLVAFEVPSTEVCDTGGGA